MPDHPEDFEVFGKRNYTNLPISHQIAVADLGTNTVVSNWPMELGGNFPMAMDETGKSVAAVFRDPSQLALFDAKTGRPISQADKGTDPAPASPAATQPIQPVEVRKLRVERTK